MKHLFLSCLFSLLFLNSCKDIKDPELRGFDSVEIIKPGFIKSTVRINVRYYNPNRFKAKLKEAKGEAWIDNIYLGTFQVDSLIQVPALNEFVVPVDLTFETLKVIQLTGNDEVLLKVTGNAKAGKGGFYRNFSLNYEGKQNIRKYFQGTPSGNSASPPLTSPAH